MGLAKRITRPDQEFWDNSAFCKPSKEAVGLVALEGINGATFASIRSGIMVSPAEERCLRLFRAKEHVDQLLRYRAAVLIEFDKLLKSSQLRRIRARANRRRTYIAGRERILHARHVEAERKKRVRVRSRVDDWDV